MVLSLKYWGLSDVIDRSNKLADEFVNYGDELSKKVQKKMYAVEGGMSNALETADYYVAEKIYQLECKEKQVRELSSETQTLIDTAKRVASEVAQMIKQNQERLFSEHSNLKPP